MHTESKKASAFRKVLTLPPEVYRKPMKITKVLIIRQGHQDCGYYICPRCEISMEREFTAFCDRCGQALDWRGYKKATCIYPRFAQSGTAHP